MFSVLFVLHLCFYDCIQTKILYVWKSKCLFQMTYNAEGEMLLPFVTHKGPLHEAVSSYFKGHVHLFQTDDGNLDRNSLCLLMLQINL